LKGALYEDKILTLFKSKINLTTKYLSTVEAEKIITNFNQTSVNIPIKGKEQDKKKKHKDLKITSKNKAKTKKVSKK
jgi:hypothetical protein